MNRTQQIGLIVYFIITVLLTCLFFKIKRRLARQLADLPSPLVTPLTPADAVVVTATVPIAHAEVV